MLLKSFRDGLKFYHQASSTFEFILKLAVINKHVHVWLRQAKNFKILAQKWLTDFCTTDPVNLLNKGVIRIYRGH